jgi:hypothetical protein
MVFVGIILVLLATEVKSRYVIASFLAFLLLTILIIISLTSLEGARNDIRIQKELKALVEEDVLTNDELLFYELFLYSAIVISGIMGTIPIFFNAQDYFKNKKKESIKEFR